MICNACAIGEHCKRLTNDLGEDKTINMLEADGRDSEEFIKILDDLNLPKPTITYEQAYFSDAEPQQVRRIKTTTGVVRKVLRDRNTALRFFKNLTIEPAP